MKNIAETDYLDWGVYGTIVFLLCLLHTSEFASQVMVEMLRHEPLWEYLYLCIKSLLIGQAWIEKLLLIALLVIAGLDRGWWLTHCSETCLDNFVLISCFLHVGVQT